MPTKSKEPGITTEDVAAIIAPGVEADVPVEPEPEALLGGYLLESELDVPAKSAGPRFGICEGTREELARAGKSIDPFTGKSLTRDDLK